MSFLEFSEAFALFLRSHLGNFSLILGAFAAVGVLAYCGEKIWTAIANNEPVNLYQFVRPFLLALLCVQFHWVVDTADSLLQPINQGIHQHFGESRAGLRARSNDRRQQLERSARGEIYASAARALEDRGFDPEREVRRVNRANNFFGTTRMQTLRNVRAVFDRDYAERLAYIEAMRSITAGENDRPVRRAVFEIIMTLAGWLYQVVKIGIQCVRIVYLSLLTLMGPIAIALSIFPGFTGNFKAWLIKYISVYLWLPVLYFVDFTMWTMNEFMITGNVTMFGAGLIVATMQIIAIFTMMSIPTMTSWMVQGGETGQGMRSPFAAAGAMLGTAGGMIAGKMMMGNAAGKAAARAINPTNGGSGSSAEPNN